MKRTQDSYPLIYHRESPALATAAHTVFSILQPERSSNSISRSNLDGERLADAYALELNPYND